MNGVVLQPEPAFVAPTEEQSVKEKVSIAVWVAEKISHSKPKRNRESHFPLQIQSAIALFRELGYTDEARAVVTEEFRVFYSSNGRLEIPFVDNPEL